MEGCNLSGFTCMCPGVGVHGLHTPHTGTPRREDPQQELPHPHPQAPPAHTDTQVSAGCCPQGESLRRSAGQKGCPVLAWKERCTDAVCLNSPMWSGGGGTFVFYHTVKEQEASVFRSFQLKMFLRDALDLSAASKD